jgi:cytochrome P450/NADPH-cytochrome P450 reductase
MGDFLKECSHRTKRPSIVQALMSGTNAQYAADMKLMTDTAAKIISDRKARPIAKRDLLSIMLTSKDPKTGEGLSDENIVRNLITFLIAGNFVVPHYYRY